MTGRAPPLDRQTPTQLWVIAVYVPLFPAAALAASFVGPHPSPDWAVWLAQGVIAAALVAAVGLVTWPRLRELRRRSHQVPGRVPPGT